MSKNLKLKIYLSLLIPFVLAAIGFVSIIYKIDKDSRMPTNYYIFAGIFGLIFWFFETRLLCIIIQKHIEYRDKKEKFNNVIYKQKE